MKKPIGRKYIIKKLDEALSKIVTKPGVCEHCGSFVKRLNCSHYYSRTLKSVRWYFDNVKCLCVGCHFWMDGHPHEHTEFVIKKIGEERFTLLRVKANIPKKWEIYELQNMLRSFKEENENNK